MQNGKSSNKNTIMKLIHRQIIKLFFSKTIKHWGLVLAIVVGVSGGIAADFVVPYFYKIIIDLVSNQSQDYQLIFRTLLWAFLASIIFEQFWRLAGIANIKIQTKVTEELLNENFEQIQKHSYSFFTNNFTGGLVKKVNRFAASYDRILNNTIWTFLTLIIRITGSLAVFLLTDLRIALAFGLWLTIFLIGLNWFLNFHIQYETSASKAETKVSSRLADTITNFENIKLFAGLRFEQRNFHQVVNEAMKKQAKSWYIFEGFFGLKGIFMVIGEFGIMYLALKLWQQGEISIGTVVLIQAYLALIMFRIWDLTHVLKDIYSDLANAEEMMEIINEKNQIKDRKNARNLQIKEGIIKFEAVTYLYNENKPLFDKLNIEIKPQEKVAIVGESGAGKSTFVKLLLRLYDVQSGKILIDDQNIKNVKQDSLRANIAFVPQDPVMFHRTIIENIRYGNIKATDAEVIQAAKLARCHDFIQKTEHGYQTMVGDRGIKLSGGERQRIAIARAILKNAPILVLDEATSSLDSKSEQVIQEALNNLMQNKTVIAIAHRLSTIRAMDRIIVVENGQVLEEGKHDELIEKDAHYAELWRIQSQ
jgi:ATP-binding cassette subfamily B protein